MQTKLTNEELTDVKKLQSSFQQKIYELGQLYLQKMQAESSIKFVVDQESKLKEEWVSLQKLENELIDKLLEKYGQGSINLSEGTFISENK